MRTTGWLKICSKKLFNADTRCLVYTVSSSAGDFMQEVRA